MKAWSALSGGHLACRGWALGYSCSQQSTPRTGGRAQRDTPVPPTKLVSGPESGRWRSPIIADQRRRFVSNPRIARSARRRANEDHTVFLPMHTFYSPRSNWRAAWRHARLLNWGTLHSTFPKRIAILACEAESQRNREQINRLQAYRYGYRYAMEPSIIVPLPLP